MASDDSENTDKTQISSIPPTGVEIGTQIIGTFEITEHIATGGMGEVYRGINIHTQEPVAIKIILAALAHDEKIISLFRKEATVLGRLHHDAIVRYNMFTIDPSINRACLVMEFVEGRSMADYIADGGMPLEDVKVMLRRIAPGLQKAHDLGVVHRDLSPDNVIVQDGLVSHTKIIDFGIAKSENFGGGTLLGGQFAGKYNYVSPEQLGRFQGKITGQSDIYSLALVAAAACRGEALDMGDNPGEAVDRRSEVPDLSGVYDEIRPLLECMLQPNPEHRPASMSDVVAMLDEPSLLQEVSQPVPVEPPAQPGVASSTPPVDATVIAPSLPPIGAEGSVPPQAAVSQPPAFGFSNPPAGSVPPTQAGENDSPFGAVPPTLGTTPPPISPTAAPETQTVAPKKSPMGIVAAILGLAIIGGGGAYVAGVFDPAATPPETTVVADTPKPQPQTPPQDDPAPDPAPDPDPEPDDLPATTDEPDQVASADLPDTSLDPQAGEVVELPESNSASVIGTNDLTEVGARIEWLQSYALPTCVHAAILGVTPTSFSIEGFATSADPFWQLLTDFEAAHGTEPDIGVRLINQSQCPVIGFLKGQSGGPTKAPRLSLDKDVLKSGEPIRGRIEQINGREIWLMLVDAQGGTYDLSSRLKPQEDGSATFALALRPNVQGGEDELVPQMIVAVASDAVIANAKAPPGTPSSVLVPLVQTELRNNGVEASAAVGYFRFDTE